MRNPARTLLAIVAFGLMPVTWAQEANSWTNSANGNWDVPANWSLGIRPGNSQSVFVTNAGWKAVAINASTPVNFPATMTVRHLTIRGAWDTYNTLLLNFAGTSIPLTVLDGLTLAENAQVLNFNSGLVVESGAIVLTNAQIIQDGGFVRLTNSPISFFDSQYHLTNGVFEAGSMLIGFLRDSHFNQHGGTAVIGDWSFAFTPGPGTGTRGIRLYGGHLSLPGGLRLEGRGGSTAIYLQEGGTNRTTDVLLMPGLSGPSPSFTLNGGLLADNNVNIFADSIRTTLRQNGGTHTVSNTLLFRGGTRTGTIRPAIYELNGGNLSASRIILDGGQGDAYFVQSNGVAQAVQIEANGNGPNHSEVILAGGSLTTANLFLTNGADLRQFDGELIVSNTVSFDGYRQPGPRIYSRYDFVNGMLFARNINVGGVWAIGDSAGTNRISNPGTIALSHTLQIGNAAEQLGRLVLASNATINLAGAASRLSFTNSSGEAWSPGATLVVSNWNGSPTGGGAEQLRFGADQTGLTPAQLSQVRFQIGTELYSARILSTGEVVPDQPIAPGGSLAFARAGNNLVLTWPAGWTLQSSTNVTGLYVNVPEATSPYTNNTTLEPRRFFRLAQ